MRILLGSCLTATTLAALALAPTASAATPGLSAVGLTAGGTKIASFTTGDGKADKQVKVTGLDGDSFLVGLDHRPQDGKLYGVGNGGGIYSISSSAVATLVDRLDVALEGTSFGVDVNPAANALRIISDTGQNLRHRFANLALPTLEDGDLNYGGTPGPNAPSGAGTSTGGTPATGVTGAAYTNNDADGAPSEANPTATGTALFDLDTTKDQLVSQNANPGILSPVGSGLGVDASDVAGFDVYSQLSGGKAVTNEAYAILTVAGERGLYAISLTSGTATFLKAVERGVSDIAISTLQ